MRGVLLFIFILFFNFTAVFSSDFYPQIPTIHGFSVNFQEEKMDELLFPVSSSQKESIKGLKYFRELEYKSTGDHPNDVQILKFYFNTITKLGGRMMYRSADFASFRVMLNGKKVCVIVETYHHGLQYSLTIMELMGQERLGADEIYSKLRSEGHVAFYFTFSSGETALSNDAISGITEISKMLKAHPHLNLTIEGHTDNVGNAEDNIKLSQKRAEVVKQALINAGVSPTRLDSKGLGDSKPIAGNTTARGRAKNRRVELVQRK